MYILIKNGQKWMPVCGYCETPLTFRFALHGHVCMNKDCSMKHTPLVDLGYRSSNGKGWCYISDEKTYIIQTNTSKKLKNTEKEELHEC